MLTSEVVNVVDRYLEKVITLEELEDWLVPRLPLFFKWPYSSLTDSITEIEVALADMSGQILSIPDIYTAKLVKL